MQKQKPTQTAVYLLAFLTTGSRHCVCFLQGPSEKNQMIPGDRVRLKVFVLISIGIFFFL